MEVKFVDLRTDKCFKLECSYPELRRKLQSCYYGKIPLVIIEFWNSEPNANIAFYQNRDIMFWSERVCDMVRQLGLFNDKIF